LIVWHSTRFARNLRDFINHMADLEKKKVKFYSIEEPEMSGSSGKAMRNLMAVFAEYQSDVTGDHTRSVKHNLKKNKKVYCPNPPLGYQNVEGKLVKDPFYYNIAQIIIEQYNSGTSLWKIAKGLNDKGIKGNKGGKFYPSTIKKVITNNIYDANN